MLPNSIVKKNIDKAEIKRADKDKLLQIEKEQNQKSKVKYISKLPLYKKQEAKESIISILTDPPINIKDYENEEQNTAKIKDDYTLLLLSKLLELKSADKFPIDGLNPCQLINMLKFLNKYWSSYDSYNKKADAKTGPDAFRAFNNTFLLRIHSMISKKLGPAGICCLATDKNSI